MSYWLCDRVNGSKTYLGDFPDFVAAWTFAENTFAESSPTWTRDYRVTSIGPA